MREANSSGADLPESHIWRQTHKTLEQRLANLLSQTGHKYRLVGVVALDGLCRSHCLRCSSRKATAELYRS